MSEYKPPFTISIEMLNLVSDISNKLGKISVFESSEAKPYLRKNNRIHSVHSSIYSHGTRALSICYMPDMI